MGHHKHSYSMKNFIHDAGAVTKPLHKDVQSLVKGANHDLNKVIDKQSGLANNLINTTGSTLDSLGSSLMLPLLLIGGGLVVFMVMKK